MRSKLSGFSACYSDTCVSVTPAFTQKTAATSRKDRRNLRQNREPDFFGCFAADVESGRREQVSDPRFEIERSIFAQARQQLSVTFSWPQQSNISKLERQKTIEREEITTKIVSHDQRGSLRVHTKIVGQF